MKLGYVIIYVDDAVEATEFYTKALGLKTGFIHESNMYAEMESGETILAFANKEMLKTGIGIDVSENKNCFEIALTTDDVQKACERAISNGAEELKKPELKPWGQTAAYVKDPFGILVEICTPMSR